MPGVLNGPAIANVPEHGLGAGSQTRDVETGFIHRLAATDAGGAHRDDRGAAWPGVHHPLRSRHGPQAPGGVAAMANLAGHGLEGHPAAVGAAITDQLKTFSATVFHRNQEVGVALGEVGEKGRLACSASA